MRNWNSTKIGAALAASASLLALTLYANVEAAEGAVQTSYHGGHGGIGNETTFFVVNIPMEAGDILRFRDRFAGDVFDLYVVEGGEGDYLELGLAAPHVYLHVPGTAPAQPDPATEEPSTGTEPARAVTPAQPILRPQYEVRRAEPAPPMAPPPGGYTGGPREAGLDVVWITATENIRPIDRRYWATEGRNQASDGSNFVVVDDDALAQQKFYYAAEIGLGGFTLALGALWMRTRSLGPHVAREERGLPGLVHLMDGAEDYLTRLRNTLAMTGILLGLTGYLLLTSVSDRIDAAAFVHGGPWSQAVFGGFLLAFAVAAATWLTHLIAVSRELRRFRTDVREATPEI